MRILATKNKRKRKSQNNPNVKEHNIQCLGINLIKDVQDLYAKNNTEIPAEEIKNQNKWEDTDVLESETQYD